MFFWKHFHLTDVFLFNPLIRKAYLTDFGLSRELAESNKEELRLKIYGRLGYLDPELFEKPRPPFEYRHDIYGLAVLYWEIMYRENPTKDGHSINPNRFRKNEECPEEFHRLYIHCQKPSRKCLGHLLEKYEPCKDSTERPSADEIVERLGQIKRAYLPSELDEQSEDSISSTSDTYPTHEQKPACSESISASHALRQYNYDNTGQSFKQALETYLKNLGEKHQDKASSIGDSKTLIRELKRKSGDNFDKLQQNVQNERNFKRWCLRIRVKIQILLNGSPFGMSAKELEIFFEQNPEELNILENFIERKENLGIKRYVHPLIHNTVCSIVVYSIKSYSLMFQ